MTHIQTPRPDDPARSAAAAAPRTATVSTLIVTYNNARQISACVRSVVADPDAGEIIVVDNDSADGTAELVEREFPQVQVIRSGGNLGFGRGCNLAAAHASGDYVLFVNPDTELRPGAIGALLALARAHPEGGLYGGRVVRPDGSPGIESCWGQPSLWGNFCFGTGLSTAMPRSPFDPESLGRWDRDSVREVGVVSGLLLLIERGVWDRLGGFDEDFFMYSEDVDLSLRATQLGYRPCITPDSVVTHEGGGSSPTSGSQRTLLLKGRVTFMRKHWSRPRRWAGTATLVLGVALRSVAGEPGWREAWVARSTWLPGYPPRTRRSLPD